MDRLFFSNHSAAGTENIQGQKSDINVSADVQAPGGARPSADTVLTDS